MKVILPTIGFDSDTLADSFHNAEYTCIYDKENNSSEKLTASSISETPDNMSIVLKQKGIKNVISKSIPPMALKLFVDLGFNVYKAEGDSVEENILLFKEDKLKSFTEIEFAATSSCTSSCSSCSSSCK